MDYKKRPKIVPSTTTKVKLVCGNLFITISELDGQIFEVFANIGKAGGCITCMLQSLTTAVTLGVRHGVPIDKYIEKLKGYTCPSVSWDEGVKYLSCIDALASLLEAKQKELKAHLSIDEIPDEHN